MQPVSRRPGAPRLVPVLAPLAALALAITTAASPGPAVGGSHATAGSAAVSRTALTPCLIGGRRGVQMSEGVRTPSGYAHATGTVRALTVMVDFRDAPGQGRAMDRFREFFPQTSNWFRTASYDRLDYRPSTPIRDWLRMPRAFREYGLQRGAPFEPGYRRLLTDLVRAADPRVDFRAYDLINVLMTPNAGPSALRTVLSVSFADNRDAPAGDGVPLANVSFVFSRQDDGSGSYARTGYRVLPHENGHIFGLPDLYTRHGGGAVGHWDIMSEDWGASNDLLAWHKWKLGWLDDDQVGCVSGAGGSEHVLTPLARRGGAKLVFVPLSPTTGLAAEVRTRGGNDAEVCKSGVLVYRVDADVNTGEGPVTVHDATPHSGGCTRSPNVHAELSDATYAPGQTFDDRDSGVRIEVLSANARGDHRIRVSRK